MRNKEGLIEKRKHQRYKVKGKAFAISSPDYKNLGQIRDISKGGLSCQFIENGEQTKNSNEIEIFSAVGDFYLKKLPVRTVLDFEIDNTVSFNSMPMRQWSMQFGKLNYLQRLLLDFFLQKYTIM
ncbi:MAG: PilZ domain-containing protein [Desulfobacterales bacterium]|jgi:hypothetical protein